jgi:hypothetical protein
MLLLLYRLDYSIEVSLSLVCSSDTLVTFYGLDLVCDDRLKSASVVSTVALLLTAPAILCQLLPRM